MFHLILNNSFQLSPMQTLAGHTPACAVALYPAGTLALCPRCYLSSQRRWLYRARTACRGLAVSPGTASTPLAHGNLGQRMDESGYGGEGLGETLGTKGRQRAIRGDQWIERRGNKRVKRVVGAKDKNRLREGKAKGWRQLVAVQEEDRRAGTWRPKGL